MEKLSDNKSKRDKEAGRPPMNAQQRKKNPRQGGVGVAASARPAVLPAEHVTRKLAPESVRN